jgi:hypothetical protein
MIEPDVFTVDLTKRHLRGEGNKANGWLVCNGTVSSTVETLLHGSIEAQCIISNVPSHSPGTVIKVGWVKNQTIDAVPLIFNKVWFKREHLPCGEYFCVLNFKRTYENGAKGSLNVRPSRASARGCR